MMAAKKSAPKASKPKKAVAAKPAPAPAKSVRKAAPPPPVKKPAAKSAPAAKAAAPARPAPTPQRNVTPPPTDKTASASRVSTYDPGDDSDGNENLLSGPRNVQPYLVKRGEEYMNKEQHEHFRRILLSWKHDLMMEVDRTVSHMKDEAANFPDPNDRATQEEEFSLELRTRDRERKLIRKIDEALARIEDGSYGYCLETGEQIGVKRLEARPVATLSIEAQERRERREKQYGDRDDRYR
jgi:DnaK suppressor protein